MKIITRPLFLCLLIAAGCQQKSGEHHHQDTEENSPNQALYDEVMNIHDEVMPKMEDLYKAKVALKSKITNSPALPESEKQKINTTLAELDSASESMMVWMRQFNPPPDSVGVDKAKAYLEKELEKVKEVKENIQQALQKAGSVH